MVETDIPRAGRRELPSLDDLDRQIGHALQLDGRAPFARIAEVLGVSDQTVARRYTKLRSGGLVRVLGLTEPEVLGETVWFLRVQATPDAAVPIGRALTRRTDTSWVAMVAGGTEVSAVARSGAEADSQGDLLLLRDLPRTRGVLGVHAYCQLHQFFGGAQGLVLKSGMLSPEQVAALAPPPAEPPGEPVVLAPDDHRLLEVLAREGRTPVAELAAATGWSPSTVRRRMAELRANGALYFDVDSSHQLYGLSSRVGLWLSVPPSGLVATGEALAAHPEVAFACATTGAANLFAIAVCRDTAALYAYLTGPVARLPDVRQVETFAMIRTLKGPGPYVPPR
ncbi:AsnC family transcriptional regulator [Streptomyces sp. SB3404]|uniref:AsnC family transcriptional regulator n=2 Tax=Streptomyces boncukensis TaxID=2711219 RepID=A0A6G4WQR7_9ACTN|nr:AsnC family transcriptional regulator [Streptomyces boncukensis]NGO67545.1 AsnC family transcriptional regulator [Streptomyces boncukensis]